MNWIKKGPIFCGVSAQLPVVDVYANKYRIYFSRRDGKGHSLPCYVDFAKNLKEIIYTSIQQPILDLGKPGSFDHNGIMPTDIITLENGIKYLYYVGWSKRLDVPYHNSIGLAISKDGGNTWKKYSEGPILSASAIDPNFIGTVSVEPPLLNLNYWRMNYSSARWVEIEGKLEPIYDIKTATSKNGLNWYHSGIIEMSLNDDEGGIAAFRKCRNRYFFSVRNKSDFRTNTLNSYKIKSVDLYMSNEDLELEPEGDELMCAYPFIIEEEDKFIMFYNTDFGKNGIYLAIKEK